MSSTRRLYRDAPYLGEFDGLITEAVSLDGKPAVVLDATCFYPTSGGQPHDLGTLNGVDVVDVVEVGDRILHVLAAPLSLGPVHGVIDWARRFDHMQQHTGQHILSQAFERELGAETVSFHLGDQSSTIDVALVALGDDTAARVEELANRVVFDNKAVAAAEYDASEVGRLALRKMPEIEGQIRVVSIEAFDLCACGGTHVRATGEVGSIHLRRWERRRDVTRVEFLCGWRALRDYRVRDHLCQALAAKFSTGVEELPAAVVRLSESEQAARRTMENLRERLLASELPRLAAEAEQVGPWRVMCRLLEGYDVGNMRRLAQDLTQQPGVVVLLAVTEPSPQVCFACAEGVALDVARLLREVIARHGGKGGGKGRMAQGGGMAAESLEALLRDARARLVGPQPGAS